MAEIKIEIDDSALQRVIANGRKLGTTSLERIRNTVAGVADKILSRAIQKAPADSGILRRSGTSEVRNSGGGLVATISFGGMASKYADVQHENPELTHTSAAFKAKYGNDIIVGIGRNGHTTPLSNAIKMMASKKPPTWSSHDASGKLKGHKGGQAHFLYGASNSAYDNWMERWALSVIEKRLANEADRLL